MQNVYCPIDDTSVYCTIICDDFSEDMSLVKNDTNDYVVKKELMFETKEQCDEYIREHCEMIAMKTMEKVDTLPDLLAYLLSHEMQHNENRMEVATLITAASAYLQIDMYEHLRNYIKKQEESN